MYYDYSYLLSSSLLQLLIKNLKNKTIEYLKYLLHRVYKKCKLVAGPTLSNGSDPTCLIVIIVLN